MPQINEEAPTLANRPSNPVIITSEEDEADEVAEKLSYASESDVNLTNGNATNNHHVEQEVIAIEKSKSDEAIQTKIFSSATAPMKKSNSSFNFLSKSRSKATKHLPSSDLDFSQDKKRGTGMLASDADLAASPEIFAKGCTLLQLCAIGNLGMVVNYLLNTFDNVNFRDYDRRTGLHVASSEGHLEVVKYLISKGARVNRTDRWGGSALVSSHIS
jgi:ankyrin repeat protein